MTCILFRCQVCIYVGDVLEEVYVKQPSGYIILGNENKMYKLKKTLYDLKQTLRA